MCKDKDKSPCFEPNVLMALKELIRLVKEIGNPEEIYGKDVELVVVKDEEDTVLLQVRKFDFDNDSSSITYYLPGTVTDVTPVGEVTVVNTDLGDIITNLGEEITMYLANINGNISTQFSLLQTLLLDLLGGQVNSVYTQEFGTPGQLNVTDSSAKSVSILFEGGGGYLQEIKVNSGHIVNVDAELNSTIDTIKFNCPTDVDPNFPHSPRVVVVTKY